MPRSPSRLLLPALALIAFTLLTPTLATAFPQGATLSSAAERPEVAPGLFSKLWDFLSIVWTTGSILDPDGANSGPSSGSEPSAATGDNGPGLDPDG